jgi:hypothetical protein
MSQNVTFLIQQPYQLQKHPRSSSHSHHLAKTCMQVSRGHLGAWFDPLGSVPTAIYPLCLQQQLAFFCFQHALLPNFVTSIDSSPREERTRFHPVPPFTNIMTEGGSTCLVLGNVNCAIPITPNLAGGVTKGMHMICKSS